MIALFCGSRDWAFEGIIGIRLEEVWKTAQKEFHAKVPSDLVILHGGAPGADTMAGKLAEERGFTVQVELADWKTHGRAAGPIRNRKMLDRRPDIVYAFLRGDNSRGTLDTISEAERRDIPVLKTTFGPA